MYTAENSQGYHQHFENDLERNKKIENVLFRLAEEGNLKACQYWLEKRLPERWGESMSAHRDEPLDVIRLADLINNPEGC